MISEAIKIFVGLLTLSNLAKQYGMTNQAFYSAPEMPECSSFSQINVGLIEDAFQTEHPFVDSSRLAHFTEENPLCPKAILGCDVTNMQGISKPSDDMPKDELGTQLLSMLTSSQNSQVKVAIIRSNLGKNTELGRSLSEISPPDDCEKRAFEYATQQKIDVLVYPSLAMRASVRTSGKTYKDTIAAMKAFPGLIIVPMSMALTDLDKNPLFPISFADKIPNLVVVAPVNSDKTPWKGFNYGKVQFAMHIKPYFIAYPCDSESNIKHTLIDFISPIPLPYCTSSHFFKQSNPYVEITGATAYLGRLIGEMKSINPKLTPKEIKDILREMGDPLVTTNAAQQGITIVNPEKTLQAVALKNVNCANQKVIDEEVVSTCEESLENTAVRPFC